MGSLRCYEGHMTATLPQAPAFGNCTFCGHKYYGRRGPSRDQGSEGAL